MDTMGFVFGMAGLSFGMLGLFASVQLGELRKELTALKQALRDAGVLTEPPAGEAEARKSDRSAR